MITYQDFGRGSAGGSVNGAASWRSQGIGVSLMGCVRGKSVVGAAGIGGVWNDGGAPTFWPFSPACGDVGFG
eukprot:4980939-Pleurochrysis_carterae.AAC.1